MALSCRGDAQSQSQPGRPACRRSRLRCPIRPRPEPGPETGRQRSTPAAGEATAAPKICLVGDDPTLFCLPLWLTPQRMQCAFTNTTALGCVYSASILRPLTGTRAQRAPTWRRGAALMPRLPTGAVGRHGRSGPCLARPARTAHRTRDARTWPTGQSWPAAWPRTPSLRSPGPQRRYSAVWLRETASVHH